MDTDSFQAQDLAEHRCQNPFCVGAGLGELRVRGRGELRFGERSAVDLAVDCQGQ